MDVLEAAKKLKDILQEVPGSLSDCSRVDDYISQLETDRIYVCVSGEFSSGKSSLVNALIGYPLLPVADIPLTSKRIEINHSSMPYLTCWGNDEFSEDEKRSMVEALQTVETVCFGNAENIADRIKWHSDMSRIDYYPVDVLCLRNFLWMYEASQRCENMICGANEGVSKERNVIVSFIQTVWRSLGKIILRSKSGSLRKNVRWIRFPPSKVKKIEVGFHLPEELRNVCLLDIPGEGSVCTYSSNAKQATQTAQIVLHVLDGERIGSKLTDDMLAESRQSISTYVYVLNKRDALSETALGDACSLLKEKYGITTIAVSALYENCSCELVNGICSVESLKNKKVNLVPLILSSKWDRNNAESNKSFVASSLHEASNIQALKDQVSLLVESKRTELCKLCGEGLRRIAGVYPQKIRKLVDAVEMAPQHKELLLRIKSNRSLSSGVDGFRNDVFRRYEYDFMPQIRSALNNLRKQFDILLSNELKLSFRKFEDKMEMAVLSTFSIPVACEIQNIIDAYFAQVRTRCDDYVLSYGLSDHKNAPGPTVWRSKDDFLKRVQIKTCEILGPILQDKAARPWLAFLRLEAFEAYSRTKQQQCMREWRKRVSSVFVEEENQIADSYRKVLEQATSPLVSFKSKIEDELKLEELNLMKLENEISNNRDRIRLHEIQSELANYIEAFETEGVTP